MPAIRKFTATMTFDEVEDEVFFTRAAIKADPDAKDLLSMTDDWLALVDGARDKNRSARIAAVDATAVRGIANHRLDRACTAFGDELYLAVDKDRNAPRWRQFFPVSVSRFTKMRFDKQVQTVKGWLTAGVADTVLDKHRAALMTWVEVSAHALEQTTSAAMVRGSARIAREQLMEDLTRERDGLFEALSARGRDRRLPRDWPNQFFRVSTRKSHAADNDDDVNDVNDVNDDVPQAPAGSDDV